MHALQETSNAADIIRTYAEDGLGWPMWPYIPADLPPKTTNGLALIIS